MIIKICTNLLILSLSFVMCAMAHGDNMSAAPKTVGDAALIAKLINKKIKDGVKNQARLHLDIQGGPQDAATFTIYYYDFHKLKQVTLQYNNISRELFLQKLFKQITHNAKTDEEKWLDVESRISTIMYHNPLNQPMYPDRSMVTDPLILFALSEGRCGQTARLIVDIALANGYRARLVQLAAHLVAEVRYNNKWHWIDADAGIPINYIKRYYPGGLPSVYELSRKPYMLDKLPFRNWVYGQNYRRTLDNKAFPNLTYNYYPAILKPSAIYFGKQILMNIFSGDKNQPRDIEYFYKLGTPKVWQKTRFYGWQHLKMEKQKIIPVNVSYQPYLIKLFSSSSVVSKQQKDFKILWNASMVPICSNQKVFQCQISLASNQYRVCVSSKSRGWDYDFRNYNSMPSKNTCNLLKKTIHCRKEICTYDIEISRLRNYKVVYIEVDPINKKSYQWPSNELVMPIGN